MVFFNNSPQSWGRWKVVRKINGAPPQLHRCQEQAGSLTATSDGEGGDNLFSLYLGSDLKFDQIDR